MNTYVGSAPSFFTLSDLVACSPKITFPKSILGSSTETNAFLQVHIKGILMGPVSDSSGRYEFIS